MEIQRSWSRLVPVLIAGGIRSEMLVFLSIDLFSLEVE